MPNELVSFWKEYRPEHPPFAHPQDHKALRDNSSWAEDDPIDFDAYIDHQRFNGDDRFHLSLLPVPYIGDLQNADIVVLLLNPGFDHSDYWAETKNPDFKNRVERNLHQDFDGTDHPFLYLDPKFCWHSGFRWWERKMREVTQLIAANKFDDDYRKALRSLSQRLACVELVPYHSASFSDHSLIDILPSVEKVKAYVLNSLAPEAITGKRTLIVTRRAGDWGLDDNEKENIIVYSGGHTRGASLGPNSRGGKAILKAYAIP